MLKTIALIAVLALSPTVAAIGGEGSFSGQMTVTDGDTLRLGKQRIRLSGIDAPEKKQTCDYNGRVEMCGQTSSTKLKGLIKSDAVTCVREGMDRYKRILAECWVRGISINEWMVANGWAVAYRAYSKKYVTAEASASSKHLGIWSSTFLPPWTWRSSQKGHR